MIAAFAASGCSDRDVVSGEIEVHSPAFGHGSAIPKRFAHDSDAPHDVSPPLAWSRVPATAKELVVIVEDPYPQRKTFVQWVLYGIPATTSGLPEGIPEEGKANGFTQGTNDFGRIGWGGPNPKEADETHKYTFWVYAVDTRVTLGPGATKDDVLKVIGRHIISSGRMIATYRR